MLVRETWVGRVYVFYLKMCRIKFFLVDEIQLMNSGRVISTFMKKRKNHGMRAEPGIVKIIKVVRFQMILDIKDPLFGKHFKGVESINGERGSSSV